MANKNNLIPGAHKLTLEEQSMGGKASAEARKRRKTLKEHLLLILEDETIQDNICKKLIERAQVGDIKAFETMRDTIGEKPTDKVDIQTNNINVQLGD